MSKTRFSKGGRKLGQSQVTELESKLGVTLPDEFRDFLMTYNGGVPKPNRYATSASVLGRVQFFYSALTGDPFHDLDLLVMHFRSELDLPVDYLPVALLENDDLLLLKVSPPHDVCEWTRIEEGFDVDHVSKLADGFAAFLASLTGKPKLAATSDPTILHQRATEAIYNDNHRKLQEILAAGHDVNFRPPDEWPLVIVATYAHDPEAIRILLSYGADRIATDNNDNSIETLIRNAIKLDLHQIQVRKQFKMKTTYNEERLKQAQEILDMLGAKEP